MEETRGPIPWQIRREQFIRAELDSSVMFDGNSSAPVSLKNKLEERYPRYQELVISLVGILDIQPSKRKLPLADLRSRAREAGFFPQEISSAQLRAQGLRRKWTIEEQKEQALHLGESPVPGKDPGRALGDGSERHGLGYVQSQPRERG